MKTQLLLTVGVIYSLTASLALRSEAVTKKTNCTVVGSTAKQEIQKFYCTVVKLYDEILMVRIDMYTYVTIFSMCMCIRTYVYPYCFCNCQFTN